MIFGTPRATVVPLRGVDDVASKIELWTCGVLGRAHYSKQHLQPVAPAPTKAHQATLQSVRKMSDGRAVVLVVNDKIHMRQFVRASLDSRGYRVVEAESSAMALSMMKTHDPGVVLLDLELCCDDRVGLAEYARKRSYCRILVFSVRGREPETVAALDAGADDYLNQPFCASDLLCRVEAALALRSHHRVPRLKLELGDLNIDLKRREVLCRDVIVRLTATEYDLLVFLAQNSGKVLTHRKILKGVWKREDATPTHVVRVHMSALRRKIERDWSRPNILITEAGVGYRLRTAT